MKLRDGIEPKIDQAEKTYPKVYLLIKEFNAIYGRANNNNERCLEIAKQLSILTHKDVTFDLLSEYLEDDTNCMVAIRLSLEDPILLDPPLSNDELMEVIQRICIINHIMYETVLPQGELWWALSHSYYLPLLKKNIEWSESISLDHLLNQKTIFEKLQYKPEEIFEKITNAMK